jgi:hypothetical protein
LFLHEIKLCNGELYIRVVATRSRGLESGVAARIVYGLDSCSFRKKRKKPTNGTISYASMKMGNVQDLPQMSKLKASEIKNQGSHKAEIPPEISGEIGPGPILFGAKALAQIVATEPRT